MCMRILPRLRTYLQRAWLATGVVCLSVLLGAQAIAADYGLFVEVETDEDLLDLLSTQEIDASEYETLVELLADGVDLNTAERDEIYALPNLTYAEVDSILLYRDEAGSIDDPVVLVTADIVEARKLIAIAPFLYVSKADRSLFETTGQLNYRTTYVAGDESVPSMLLGGRLSTFRNLNIGIITVLTRDRLSDVVYDPNRDALSANAPSAQVNVPKFWAEWKTKSLHVVAGTYRIGFGQRLTFDNTSQVVPNGIKLDKAITYSQTLTSSCKESDAGEGELPCTSADRSSYQAPDYRWTDRLRGVAIGLRHLEIGDGWMQAHGWISYQTRSIYQYEIYDRGSCDDPRDDSDLCSAPSVYRRQDDLLAPTSRFKTSTLPDMFNELLGGGNLTYYFSRRAHIGVTGYGADIQWLVQGMDLDFQEWSRLPYGGPFGAVGLNGAWGIDFLDLAVEAARSFDGQPAGGGWAAVARGTATWQKHELEAVLRYYEKNYANPFARPISAADEYDGLRARDEAGLRLKYSSRIDDLHVRVETDFWGQLSDEAAKIRFKGRLDYDLDRWIRPGVWIEYQDKDLDGGGRLNTCFETPFEEEEGEPVPCTGEKIKIGAQVKLMPIWDMAITLKYEHRLLDDARDTFDSSLRQDSAAWFTVSYKPRTDIRLQGRVKYQFEDLSDNAYKEQSVWAYLEGQYQYERDFRIKLRYEVFSWLDDRESTAERVPNPAHWLRLELEYRF